MKKIDFVGKTWEVPDWANFITQDSCNGNVCVWEKVPRQFSNDFFIHSQDDVKDFGKAEILGRAEIPKAIQAI